MSDGNDVRQVFARLQRPVAVVAALIALLLSSMMLALYQGWLASAAIFSLFMGTVLTAIMLLAVCGVGLLLAIRWQEVSMSMSYRLSLLLLMVPLLVLYMLIAAGQLSLGQGL